MGKWRAVAAGCARRVAAGCAGGKRVSSMDGAQLCRAPAAPRAAGPELASKFRYISVLIVLESRAHSKHEKHYFIIVCCVGLRFYKSGIGFIDASNRELQNALTNEAHTKFLVKEAGLALTGLSPEGHRT
jgi:hypothetical protein